jgi:crotonobetainyl-CoA:carnitine CoA-transferase CaiB-like acyl-CoA transferase
MWSHTFQGEGIQKSGELADYFQIFKTADGYVAIILVTEAAFQQTCELIGSELHLDPRYTSLPARLANRHALQQDLDAALAGWKTQDLCAGLDAADIPVARVNTPTEVFTDPQVLEQGAILAVEHPVAGAMRIANTPFHFHEQRPLPARHAPTLGQHSAEILSELGCDQRQLDRIEELERGNREKMAGFALSKAR